VCEALLHDLPGRRFFEDYYDDRIIDKARLILSRFSKKGILQRILDHRDELRMVVALVDAARRL
jgi:hypothetical protein